MSNRDASRKSRIRVALIVVFGIPAVAILAGIGFFISIPFTNDAVARQVEADLLELPLPERTEHIDSMSQVGRFAGAGNGTEYLGAVLLESELSLEQLKEHFASDAVVVSTTGLNDNFGKSWAKRLSPGEGSPNRFIIYKFGEAPSGFHYNSDLRGH